MSKRLRLFQKDQRVFITQRCSEERFFLEPSETVNFLIGSILARAQELYGIKILAYIFMSNHFHLVLLDENMNCSKFMAYFSGNLAKALNQHLGRHGDVWEDRYSAQPILDDEALQDRIDYCEWNPVKAGLCRIPEEWSGLSSAKQESEEITFSVLHKREWNRSSSCSESQREKHTHKHVLRLTNFKKRVKVETMEFLNQNPFDRPKNPKRSKAPLCFGALYLAALYRSAYEKFCKTYREISSRFRDGELLIEFPEGSFRPTIPDVVRYELMRC